MADKAVKPTEEVMEPVTSEAVEETPVTETAEQEAPATEEPKTAKAGKRSAKAVAEAEEKQAKEERKASGEAAAEKPKQPVKPTRSRLERQGKNFRKAADLIEKDKAYNLPAALELATKTNPVKFDASVEVHIRLNVDPRHADQNIRDNLVLPAGTGKKVRVAVFADDAVENADIVGTEAVLKLLEKGNLDFDILIASPATMPKLGKYARVLGPRGLMPNPKSGTIVSAEELPRTIREVRGGRVEFRNDKTGLLHVAVGKVSFDEQQIYDNIAALMDAVKTAKPSASKGTYVRSVTFTSTMGPGIRVDPAAAQAMNTEASAS